MDKTKNLKFKHRIPYIKGVKLLVELYRYFIAAFQIYEH